MVRRCVDLREDLPGLELADVAALCRCRHRAIEQAELVVVLRGDAVAPQQAQLLEKAREHRRRKTAPLAVNATVDDALRRHPLPVAAHLTDLPPSASTTG